MATPEFGPIRLHGRPAHKHAFVSVKADLPGLWVKPSHWNAEHVGSLQILKDVGGNQSYLWTNMPSALTEFLAVTHLRFIVDLTNISHLRLEAPVVTVGEAGAKIGVQVQTDLTGGGAWAYPDGATGPVATITATGNNLSAEVAVHVTYRTIVLARFVGLVS